MYPVSTVMARHGRGNQTTAVSATGTFAELSSPLREVTLNSFDIYELGGAVNGFGDYLYVDCADGPSVSGGNKFIMGLECSGSRSLPVPSV